jgi:hypothetical protein
LRIFSRRRWKTGASNISSSHNLKLPRIRCHVGTELTSLSVGSALEMTFAGTDGEVHIQTLQRQSPKLVIGICFWGGHKNHEYTRPYVLKGTRNPMRSISCCSTNELICVVNMWCIENKRCVWPCICFPQFVERKGFCIDFVPVWGK